MGAVSKEEWATYIARIQAECAAGQAEARREYRRQWMASKRARRGSARCHQESIWNCPWKPKSNW
jgi:hypothetical protein